MVHVPSSPPPPPKHRDTHFSPPHSLTHCPVDMGGCIPPPSPSPFTHSPVPVSCSPRSYFVSGSPLHPLPCRFLLRPNLVCAQVSADAPATPVMATADDTSAAVVGAASDRHFAARQLGVHYLKRYFLLITYRWGRGAAAGGVIGLLHFSWGVST